MQTTYLSLGSNLGDKADNLRKARSSLEQHVGLIEKSSALYATAAWGKTDQPDFLNQVVQISTALSARDLLSAVLNIEASLGRERLEMWGARTVDIDILFYGRECVNEQDLVIPHPLLQHRRFVLKPLAEIASSFYHPVLKITIAELLSKLSDDLPVKPV